MAWTSTTLKTAIQDYLETDETTFVANLDNIIVQAEKNILLKVQLPDFRATETPLMSTGSPILAMPSDFLAPYSLAIDNTGYEYLTLKQIPFLREVYPDTSVTGVPRYYAIASDANFLVAPVPNANYACELNYFYSPASITTAGTSWLGTHADRALLTACLYEGYKFLKGDGDLIQVYQQDMMDALSDLRLLAEGRNKTDEHRNG